MAENRRRPGVSAKKKKGPTRGSGGKGRRSLEGRGPTPKAEDRVYHAAHQRKKAAEQSPARTAERPRAAADMVLGRNSVLEALRAHVPASTLYVATGVDSDDRVSESLHLAAERNIDMREVGRPDLDRIAGGSHQGIAMQVPPYDYADPIGLLDQSLAGPETPLFIALDGITDPHNLGAVLRSGAAFGAHGVIVPSRRSAGMTPAAWKVSAGAAARLPVARGTNLVRTLQSFQKAGCFVVGLDGEGEAGITDLHLATEPLVLVLGSEGRGLSRLVRETCDMVVNIPIAAQVESLNASVAMGIGLYEVARQRGSSAG